MKFGNIMKKFDPLLDVVDRLAINNDKICFKFRQLEKTC